MIEGRPKSATRDTCGVSQNALCITTYYKRDLLACYKRPNMPDRSIDWAKCEHEYRAVTRKAISEELDAFRAVMVISALILA
jgi:hypothetical protein